jgi:hypothetical protein
MLYVGSVMAILGLTSDLGPVGLLPFAILLFARGVTRLPGPFSINFYM